MRIDLPDRTLYKSGVTSRPIAKRLTEIKHDLRAYGTVELEPIAVVKSAGFLEAYFKRKYARFQHRLSAAKGLLTEYFDLPDEELSIVVASLNALVSDSVYQHHHPADRAARIRAGMRKAQQSGKAVGRPKVAESKGAFLQKDKSRIIRQMLQSGSSLREIERQTGYSINTIRKVYRHLKEMDNQKA